MLEKVNCLEECHSSESVSYRVPWQWLIANGHNHNATRVTRLRRRGAVFN